MTGARFISFEGGEGCGKSTHMARLADGLRGTGIDVVMTREPGGTPGAESIRDLLVRGGTDRWDALTEALLHYAARRDHVGKTVRPALEAGRWVISDRFADSTVAYQGYGLGVEVDVILRLHALAIGDFWPDLTIILDLPVSAGLARAGTRATREDRYERMGADLHERVRAGFLEIAAREPARCVVIDSSGPEEETQAAVRAAVRERLGATLP